jgi:hypothetical protein
MAPTPGFWRDLFVTPRPDNPSVGTVREYLDLETGLFHIIGPFGTPSSATGLKILSGGYCAAFGVQLYGRGTGFAVNNEGTFIDGGGNQITNPTNAGNLFTGGGTFSSRFSVATASSANAGSNGDVPAQVLGYQIGSLRDGTVIKIPYYAA